MMVHGLNCARSRPCDATFNERGCGMKVLHVSDLHIGKRVNGMSMLDDQRYILRQILDIAEKHQVSVLLIAGDI